MPDFGSSFVDAYTAVRGLGETAKRTAIMERQDARAQEKHEWEAADIEEIKAMSTELANDTMSYTQSMAKLGQAAQGQPQAQGLQPPEGVGPPAPDGTPAPTPAAPAVKPPTTADYINAAREHTAKITPKLIKILSKAHPLEASKLALGMADTAIQDKMTKSTALVGMLRSGFNDPAIPQLLEELVPTAVKGSFHRGPPDAKGNHGYGQFTETMPDGSTREVRLTPVELDAMLMQNLSAPKMLEELRAGKEQGRKEKETAGQIETWKATRDLAERTFKEGTRRWEEELPIRKATAAAAGESAAASRAYKEAIIEDKVEGRAMKRQNEVMRGMANLYGIKPEMMADESNPQRNKFLDVFAGIDTLAKVNKIDLDLPTATRLAKVMESIASGGDGLYQKDGRYGYNMGNGKMLEVPSFLLPQQKGPQKKAAAITPP